MSEQGGAARAGGSVTEGAAPAARLEMAEMLASPAAGGRWVIDPAGSRALFAVKQFWGAATVHGSLGPLSGEGSVGADGTVTSVLTIDAASLNTNNKVRDAHLRSADFFDVKRHPHLVVTVTAARPAGPAALDCQGVIEAAGRVQPVEFTAHVRDLTPDAVVIEAELLVDRTGFAMTWSLLGVASATARGSVVARFIRPHADEATAQPAAAAEQRPVRTAAARPDSARLVRALRQSHDALKALIEPLDAGQLEQQSYAPEWSIAQVLSHLGSQAEIFELFLDAAMSGNKPPGPEAFGPIWEVWNAKSAQAQAAEGLAADAAFVKRLESYGDAELRLPLLGMDLDVAGLSLRRLSEHTQHSWDIAVALDPTATLAAEATVLLVDSLGQLVGRAAKPGRRRRWRVRTTDPERIFILETGESATLAPSEGEAGPADLVLPAEAFIRLVCGQLDAAHTPPIAGGAADLDELRAIFTGF